MSEETLLGEITADIAIDVHEPLDIIEALNKSGKKVVVESLPTDIMIPGTPGLALERKEVSDFFNTFTSDRFADQMIMLKTLKDTGIWRVGLLLEGSVLGEMKQRSMNAIAMQNMLTSVVWGWDIPIYRTEKKDFTAKTILYLADKVSGKKSFVPPRKTADRDKPPEDQAAYVAAGFPGIGAKTLDMIRGETDSLYEFIHKAANFTNAISLTEKKQKKIAEVLLANWRLSNAST